MSAGKTVTHGTDESVPYRGAVQNSACTTGLRSTHGFVGTKIDSRRERIYPFRCDGFVGTYRSGNRKKRIGTSVNAPLKQCSAYGADIITPHLPQAASSPQAPQGEDNWVQPNFALI